MMRQSTQLLEITTEKQPKSMNGRSTAISEDGFEPDMDLDEPMRDGDDWEKMDTEEGDNYKADGGMKYDMLLQTLIQYGQELKAEFQDDSSPLVRDTFKEMFSLFSYQDPRKSPHGALLDIGQRAPVAERINSAILGNHQAFDLAIYMLTLLSVSLGKSSTTALERLYKQTSILIDLVSEEGGAGAFINVREILKASRTWQ